MCGLVVPARAQPHHGAAKAEHGDKAAGKHDRGDRGDRGDHGKKAAKVKNFDFTGMDLNGRMRTPQLLYFLERANEELERASLEKRSFIPAMVRSVEEEQL
jgi:hypothetical protein